ncbi:alpha/beta hydrolase [uncultured Limosilactobacillus sp.]|uniref:RBBP9/YdeN family alpha/beta hydrolase n=1 Tax=uncultured Limosilactobacillus sp. TaxID=2837629 RepID=UPI0025D884CB|nr:alpha/beta hydrolase [uncultured Limosilactobacillus sp.]
MKTAYLIHGTSTRDDDWFPWLAEAVVPTISLERLWLPEPFSPDVKAWDAAIDEQIQPTYAGLTMVAHSLGCLAALRYVNRHSLHDVRLLLVGAFAQPLPHYPELNHFMEPALDFQKIRAKVSRAVVITAQNDPIAPYQDSVAVANQLNAKLIVRPTGGHFLSSDGFQKFPLVKTELINLME